MRKTLRKGLQILSIIFSMGIVVMVCAFAYVIVNRPDQVDPESKIENFQKTIPDIFSEIDPKSNNKSIVDIYEKWLASKNSCENDAAKQIEGWLILRVKLEIADKVISEALDDLEELKRMNDVSRERINKIESF